MTKLLLIVLWGLLFSGSTYETDYWLFEDDDIQ